MNNTRLFHEVTENELTELKYSINQVLHIIESFNLLEPKLEYCNLIIGLTGASNEAEIILKTLNITVNYKYFDENKYYVELQYYKTDKGDLNLNPDVLETKTYELMNGENTINFNDYVYLLPYARLIIKNGA